MDHARLGRIASTGSRAHLKDLLRSSGEARRRSSIVLELARIGHPDDTDFLAGVLGDETIDEGSRSYAALGLGRIGGEQVVPHLQRALPTASTEIRRSIATVLGNTRSRAAVPALIAMFGDDASHTEFCSAMSTLTHRAWCDGSAHEPADTQQDWLRWWNQNRTRVSLFGPDSCPAEGATLKAVPNR